MLKKMLLLSCLFVLGLSAFSLAETGNNALSKDPMPVEVMYCNKGLKSELLTEMDALVLDAGESKKICLAFLNSSSEEVTIKYGYVNADISEIGQPLCSADLWKGNFPALVQKPDNDVITIPANSHLVQYDNLSVPFGLSGGLYHGCVVFELANKEKASTGTMFTLIRRKVAPLDVLVGGMAELKSAFELENIPGDFFMTNKHIKGSLNENGEFVLAIKVKNNGNVTQIVSFSGAISNFLGYQQKFSVTDQKIGAGQSVEIPVVIGIIPSYKGLFDVKLQGNYKPSFIIDPTGLPEEVLNGKTFQESGKLFVFSWILIGALVLVLLILWRLFKPRRQ